MKIINSLSVTLAASMLITAPAMAQPMSPADARAQLDRLCSETSQRTDQAGREWYAANCTPAAMARYNNRRVNPAATATAVMFGLGVIVAAIFAD